MFDTASSRINERTAAARLRHSLLSKISCRAIVVSDRSGAVTDKSSVHHTDVGRPPRMKRRTIEGSEASAQAERTTIDSTP